MNAPLLEVDEGWDYKVLILDGEWVLRIPRSAVSAAELEKEIELLPALAPVLPVQIPEFERVSRKPLFVVYRLIRGQPIGSDDPAGVRAFLDALHSFDWRAVAAPRPDWRGIYRQHAEDWTTSVLPLLERAERARAAELLAEIETLAGFEEALVHCDLGPAHLICREGRLVGVIDWGDAKVGDPAIDYAWILNVPFPGWDVDEELRRRARIYHRLGPWFEVEFGLRRERPEWVESGLAGLRSRL